MRLLLAAVALSPLFLPAATIPRPAGDISFVAPGGKTHKLSDYKGKVVVVEIMSTTCPHCQTGAQILSRLNRQYGSKGFQPLGIAINDGADMPGFIKEFNVNFPVGKGKRDDAFGFLQHSIMNPNFYFPQMAFIDRNGTVRAQYGGTDAFLQTNEEANIRNMVEKLLAEGAATSAKPAPRAAKPKKASTK